MTLAEVKKRYYAIVRQLGASAEHVCFATTPRHDGSPHVECDGGELHYVVTERGQEHQRRVTRDPDEILSWLISDLTWEMASEWEVAHRSAGEDIRRQLFRRHVELLRSVNPDWAAARRAKYEELLNESYPFG
jgi:hypothetical protein